MRSRIILAVAGLGLSSCGAQAQTPVAARQAFDVVWVKPVNPEAASRTASGVASDRFPACGGYRLQIDSGRFSAGSVTLFKLITWAYGIRYSCYIVNDAGLVAGGPKWVLLDRFDIQATLPAGAPAYTPQQLLDSDAPELQAMLRSLLADRFKVELRRELRQMSVYELTVAAGGPKLPPSLADQPKRESLGIQADENGENLVRIRRNKASIADLGHLLETVTNTPVLDRTGLTGDYSFDVKFAVLDPSGGRLGNIPWATGPSVFSVISGQLGLRLAASKGEVGAWVIDHAERPSED